MRNIPAINNLLYDPDYWQLASLEQHKAIGQHLPFGYDDESSRTAVAISL